MAEKNDEDMVWGSVAKYSKTRKISRQFVYTTIKKFGIKQKGTKVPFNELDKILRRKSEGQKLEKATDKNDTNRLTKARADKETTKAEIEDLKLAEMQGQLLHREAIVTAMQRIVGSARKEIIALPSKLTPQIAACGGNEREINEVLTAAINEVMDNLYALKNVINETKTSNN
ncbi:MAG: hypothetical protein HRU28_09440 [Rhizobiales bacterium]|nr:hypothetical protein [Hyphomicrobiales bacterium]